MSRVLPEPYWAGLCSRYWCCFYCLTHEYKFSISYQKKKRKSKDPFNNHIWENPLRFTEPFSLLQISNFLNHSAINSANLDTSVPQGTSVELGQTCLVNKKIAVETDTILKWYSAHLEDSIAGNDFTNYQLNNTSVSSIKVIIQNICLYFFQWQAVLKHRS